MSALLVTSWLLFASKDPCAVIRSGDVAAARAMLAKRSALPKCQGPVEFYALVDAKDEAGLAMLDLIVSRGGKWNATLEDGTGLLAYARTAEVAKGLLARGVKCGPTDLESVTEESTLDLGVFTTLLEAGCASDGVLVGAAKNAAAVKLLLARGAKVNEPRKGITALHIAALYGSLESARLLLDAGAELNGLSSRGQTATDYAASTRRLDVLKFLVEKGGRITHLDEVLADAVDDDATRTFVLGLGLKLGPTEFQAMHRVATLGRPELVAPLVAAGADPDVRAPKTKLTPLMVSIRSKQWAAATRLLEVTKNVDAADAHGDTALMMAAELNEPTLVTALLAKKANQGLKNAEGKSAVMLAEEARSVDVLRLLAPDTEASGTDALIWGGGATPADAEKWLARWNDEAAAVAPLVTLAPGYPRLVKSDDFAGLKPGFHIVLLGLCPVADSRHALGLLKGVAERAYARRVQLEATNGCPSRPKQLQRGRFAVSTVEAGARLQAVEVWSPEAQGRSEVWVTLRSKEGALLDRAVLPGTSDTCKSLALEATPGAVEVITTCDEEIQGGKCRLPAGVVTARFTARGGKLKRTDEDDRETECFDHFIGGCD